MPEIEAEQFKQGGNPILKPGLQQANEHGVACIECHPDGYGFAVAYMVAGQRFDLVRGPMTEVEGTRAATLERIAGVRNLMHVELGTPADHGRHDARFE